MYPHAERPTGRIWKWIERQNRATKSGENICATTLPICPCADHADCFAVHVEPVQAVESEITFSDAIINARCRLSVERQHKSDGVLGHRRKASTPERAQTVMSCLVAAVEIDVCYTRRTAMRSALRLTNECSLRNHRGIYLIVYKTRTPLGSRGEALRFSSFKCGSKKKRSL